MKIDKKIAILTIVSFLIFFLVGFGFDFVSNIHPKWFLGLVAGFIFFVIGVRYPKIRPAEIISFFALLTSISIMSIQLDQWKNQLHQSKIQTEQQKKQTELSRPYLAPVSFKMMREAAASNPDRSAYRLEAILRNIAGRSAATPALKTFILGSHNNLNSEFPLANEIFPRELFHWKAKGIITSSPILIAIRIDYRDLVLDKKFRQIFFLQWNPERYDIDNRVPAADIEQVVKLKQEFPGELEELR